jgi:hypothetical protein
MLVCSLRLLGEPMFLLRVALPLRPQRATVPTPLVLLRSCEFQSVVAGRMQLALRVAAFGGLLGWCVLRQSLRLRATTYATGLHHNTFGVPQRMRREGDSIAKRGRRVRLEDKTARWLRVRVFAQVQLMRSYWACGAPSGPQRQK